MFAIQTVTPAALDWTACSALFLLKCLLLSWILVGLEKRLEQNFGCSVTPAGHFMHLTKLIILLPIGWDSQNKSHSKYNLPCLSIHDRYSNKLNHYFNLYLSLSLCPYIHTSLKLLRFITSISFYNYLCKAKVRVISFEITFPSCS